MRFAAVISHPIQHYSPIFSRLAAEPDVDVKVFYLCDHGVRESFDAGFARSFAWDVPLTEGHAHEFLRPGFRPTRFSFLEMDSPELPRRLEEFSPDLIWLHGYGQRMCWRALSWAKGRCRTVYFGDSELLHARNGASLAIKRLVLPFFFSRCDAFITIGDNNEAYYCHYGVAKEKLYRGACPIEVERFLVDSDKRKKWRTEIRERYGIGDEDSVVLFSGKLRGYKRPLDLVSALEHVGNTKVHALFIGDGPLRGDIEKRAIECNVSSHIHVTGFVNQSEIPKYISAGDILAVTSERDAHPLSVSEALPFGLPVIASDKVGCVGPSDTARPGENAMVYPCGDVTALAAAISRLTEDEALKERYANASRAIAYSQDVSVTVDVVKRIASNLCHPGVSNARI